MKTWIKLLWMSAVMTSVNAVEINLSGSVISDNQKCLQVVTWDM
jgi:hypothetical protein